MLRHLQHTLQDSFEKNGSWWLPTEPDKQVHGIIRYDSNKDIRLELFGTFRSGFLGNDLFIAEIIQGVTSDGIMCTLMDNIAVSEPINSTGERFQIYRSQSLMLGGHFETLNDLQFNSYAVNFHNLENWLFHRPYSFTYKREEGSLEYEIHWPTHNLLNSKMDELGGTISLFTELYPLEESATTIHVRNDAFLKWTPKSPQHFDNFRQLFFKIQHFLTLLFGENTFPRRIIGYVQDEKERDWPTAIFYNLPTIPVTKTIYRHEMLITYDKISERLAFLLDTWVSNAEMLQPVYDYFFSTLSRPDMFLQNRFLNLVQALEVYHRVIVGGDYLSEENYQEYRLKLYDFVSEILPSRLSDMRKALKARLKWGFQYSQRYRITTLIKGLGEELRMLVTTQKVNDFVDNIINTRNDLVHRGKTERMGNKEMYYACQRLRILLTILLLQSLGLTDSLINEAISNNRKIQPLDKN